MADGHPVRPFSERCGVKCREYSLPLQRRIADFGADVPFGKVPEKITEHYGITVPCSSIRNITEKHGEGVKAEGTPNAVIPYREGAEYIIAETDGSMIPIVATDGKETDRRKNRKYRWKEARLTLTHPKGSVSSVFGCTLGSPDEKPVHRCSVERYVRERGRIQRCIVSETVRHGLPIRLTECSENRAVF